MGTMAVRSMAIMLGLLLLMVAAVMVVNGSVALAIEYQGPGDAPPVLTEEGSGDCEVGYVYTDEPDCDCPEGTSWVYEYGYDGDYQYIISGVCVGSSTSLTGDLVPSLTQTDTATQSVGQSAYSTYLPSTGLPVLALLAGGLAAAGAGALVSRKPRR